MWKDFNSFAEVLNAYHKGIVTAPTLVAVPSATKKPVSNDIRKNALDAIINFTRAY